MFLKDAIPDSGDAIARYREWIVPAFDAADFGRLYSDLFGRPIALVVHDRMSRTDLIHETLVDCARQGPLRQAERRCATGPVTRAASDGGRIARPLTTFAQRSSAGPNHGRSAGPSARLPCATLPPRSSWARASCASRTIRSHALRTRSALMRGDAAWRRVHFSSQRSGHSIAWAPRASSFTSSPTTSHRGASRGAAALSKKACFADVSASATSGATRCSTHGWRRIAATSNRRGIVGFCRSTPASDTLNCVLGCGDATLPALTARPRVGRRARRSAAWSAAQLGDREPADLAVELGAVSDMARDRQAC